MSESIDPDYPTYSDDALGEDMNGWLCICGKWLDGDCHCRLCNREAPWGCDCGAQDEDLDEEDEDLGYFAEGDLDA